MKKPIKKTYSCLFLFLILFFPLLSEGQNCNYTLDMHDSYGDGWNGASVDIIVNGSSQGPFTFTTGYESSVVVSIPHGATVDIVYSSGSYENEVTYEFVTPGGANEYSTGTYPPTGTVHSFSGDCSVPNDGPCEALTLMPNCTEVLDPINNLMASSSGVADPGCANYMGGDFWFQFTAPASGSVQLTTSALGITQAGMAVYSGTCGSLTLMDCDDNSGPRDMPELTPTGLTPGNTYFVRLWEEGNDVQSDFELSIEDTSLVYCYHGTAVPFTPAGHLSTDNCARITQALADQNGCIWNDNQIDFSQDFDYSFIMSFGSDGGGADGCTFTFQNQGAGTCGSAGQDLGTGGITPAVVIEFDTYNNGGLDELVNDHIAVDIDGNLVSGGNLGMVDAVSGGTNITDGFEHNIQVTWVAATKLLSIYFDSNLRLQVTNDFVNTVFGGDPTVYWGFTGSTGLLTNEHYFCPGTLPVTPPTLPLEILDLNITCKEKTNQISWKTGGNGELDVTIEKSYDGNTFFEGQQIHFYGSENYSTLSDEGFSFFRLKLVDENGGISYSRILSSECSSIDEVKIYPNPVSETLFFHNMEIEKDTKITIFNNLGSIVFNSVIKPEGSNYELNLPPDIGRGFYTISLKTADQIQHLKIQVQ